MKLICPDHQIELAVFRTRFGLRHNCTVAGCTVVCWGGRTSTPANAETRALRHRCHKSFDPLWKDKLRFQHRTLAYVWLRRLFGLTEDEAHIGRFSKEQCERLLTELDGVYTDLNTGNV